MASLEGTRSRGHLNFEILEDNHHGTDQTSTTARKTCETDTSVLGELAVNTIYEAPHGTPGSSTFAPEKPLRQTPLKENVKEKVKDKRHEQRPQHQKQPSSTSLLANSKDGKGPVTGAPHHPHPLAVARSWLPTNEEQLSKHLAGQFEWILTVPARQDSATKYEKHNTAHRDPQGSTDGQKLYFGCNLVQRGGQPGDERHSKDSAADRYTALATRIEGDEDSGWAKTAAPCTAGNLSDCGANRARSDSQMMASIDEDVVSPRRISEIALSGKNDDIVEQIISLPPANLASRIEDSVEALDELEEQLEAMNAVAQLERILSPVAEKTPAQGTKQPGSASRALQRTGSTSNRSPPKPGTNTLRVKTVERKASVRKTNTTPPTQGGEKDGARDPFKRLLATRPTSLLPPKPPARSSKPPTIPTFELPGEAVARRLKEQREARLSKQITPEKAAAAVPPARTRSTKPPTRPTFELPGEAISRRKREEHEAKLRQQAEEERRRREFKARPNRSSIVPNTLPRETISSRARLNKAAEVESPARAAPGANKRQSMAFTLARTSSTLAPGRSSMSTSQSPSRGRGSAMGSSSTQVDRETSASTGSVHGSIGKRSTMSAEELKRQGVRGRDIYTRDNSYVVDRERERREREAIAKQAREEAAERSRQLSREWAEKQQRKKLVG